MLVQFEKRRELWQSLLSIIGHVRKQSGCLQADAYQSIENEREFLVVETWATQKDTDDHLKSDIFSVMSGAGCLMDRMPEIEIRTVDGSTELKN